MNSNQNSAFLAAQSRAISEMREMNAKAKQTRMHNMPPMPSFVETNNTANISSPESDSRHTEQEPKKAHASQKDFLSSLNIPILSELKTDKDISLILGLVLILTAEKSDRLLLIALMYILL